MKYLINRNQIYLRNEKQFELSKKIKKLDLNEFQQQSYKKTFHENRKLLKILRKEKVDLENKIYISNSERLPIDTLISNYYKIAHKPNVTYSNLEMTKNHIDVETFNNGKRI